MRSPFNVPPVTFPAFLLSSVSAADLHPPGLGRPVWATQNTYGGLQLDIIHCSCIGIIGTDFREIFSTSPHPQTFGIGVSI